MKWFLMGLKKFADFKGRSRRKEYWYFLLFYYIFSIVLLFVDKTIGSPYLQAIFVLAIIVPYFAVAVRRMHDTDRSGWYILVPIYNIVLFCTNGTPGGNQYGPDPKQPEMHDEIDLIGNN
jgi:uncharacterized membrane protein YhaH (DUF805 family)